MRRRAPTAAVRVDFDAVARTGLIQPRVLPSGTKVPSAVRSAVSPLEAPVIPRVSREAAAAGAAVWPRGWLMRKCVNSVFGLEPRVHRGTRSGRRRRPHDPYRP